MADVKDLKLSKQGRDRVEWAYQDMPVLQEINKSMSKTSKRYEHISVSSRYN